MLTKQQAKKIHPGDKVVYRGALRTIADIHDHSSDQPYFRFVTTTNLELWYSWTECDTSEAAQEVSVNLGKVDWFLLHNQKEALAKHLSKQGLDNKLLWGIVELLDNIIFQAADTGLLPEPDCYPEEEVTQGD